MIIKDKNVCMIVSSHDRVAENDVERQSAGSSAFDNDTLESLVSKHRSCLVWNYEFFIK